MKKKESSKGYEVIKGFEAFLRAGGIRSVENYRATATEFLCWCAEERIPYRSLDVSQSSRWRSEQIKAGLSHGTINNKCARLRRFYTYLRKKNQVLSNPFSSLKSLRTTKSLPKNILNIEEVDLLLRRYSVRTHGEAYLKTVLEILYGSALRISETATLKIEDIDYERGGFLITEHKKDGLRRWVPATESSLRAIDSYRKAHRAHLVGMTEIAAGYLFPQEPTATLRQRFNRSLRTTCRRLGLRDITSHSLRHSAATHLLAAGAGIRQVQEFLGHQKIMSTQRYTRVIKEDLKAVVDHHHPRSPMLR